MERLGLSIEPLSPDFDEREAERSMGVLPTPDVATALALGKAKSLAAACPGALILGADQIAEQGGERLHKPGTAENACAQLARLQGRTHQLVTAVTLLDAATGRAETLVDTHRLTMRPLSPAEIERYVAHDSPLDCAGSYRVESLGIALFERIEGNDFTAIIGLPLTHVVTLLARFGAPVLG
ncbi:MAG: Maf family protein [Polyangiaceae bacterium]